MITGPAGQACKHELTPRNRRLGLPSPHTSLDKSHEEPLGCGAWYGRTEPQELFIALPRPF